MAELNLFFNCWSRRRRCGAPVGGLLPHRRGLMLGAAIDNRLFVSDDARGAAPDDSTCKLQPKALPSAIYGSVRASRGR